MASAPAARHVVPAGGRERIAARKSLGLGHVQGMEIAGLARSLGEAAVDLLNVFSKPLAQTVRGASEDPPRPFVTNLVVPAKQILMRGDETHREAVGCAIKGKLVLVGEDIIGASDRVVSPVQGAVPGVLLHAQALDNLIVWNTRVWRPVGDEGVFSTAKLIIVAAAAFLFSLHDCLRFYWLFGEYS